MAGISFPLDENHNFSKAFKPLPEIVLINDAVALRCQVPDHRVILIGLVGVHDDRLHILEAFFAIAKLVHEPE